MPLIDLHIERLSQLGEGVAHHEGRTVFVRGGLPGERVAVELIPHGKVLRGEIREWRERAPGRRDPMCPLADRCGGCDWLHANEAVQQEAKREIVLSSLEHNGRIGRDEYELRPFAVSPKSFGYRRRAVMHFHGGRLGFFGHRSHDFVVVDRCPALVPDLEDLPSKLSPALAPIAKDIDTVDLLAEAGKHAFALFLKTAVKPKHREVAELALRELGAQGAVLVPNEGAPVQVGRPALRALSPLRPEVPIYLRPDAFAQANAEANVGLVTSALYELGPTESDRVLELYAGNGNFTFPVAAVAREVLAVESTPVSLSLGQRSTQEGRVANVRWVQGDARRVVEGLVKEGEKFDLLLADPPRTGASGIDRWAAQLGVRRVVYVACDPASLARDAAALKAQGFAPRALQIVDMFPQTRHVEAVMSFERRAP